MNFKKKKPGLEQLLKVSMDIIFATNLSSERATTHTLPVNSLDAPFRAMVLLSP